MVIDFGLASFGNLLTKRMGEGFINAFRPTARMSCPLFYAFSLLRSTFDLSFEVVAIRCSSAI